MRLGLFFNPHYPQRDEIYAQLEQLRHAHGLELWALRDQSDILPPFVKQTMTKAAGSLGLEAILVFGGDGTMLRSAPFSLASGAPLLGVNLGRLGFLSDTQLSELDKVIVTLRKGKYTLQERMQLKAVLKRGGKSIFEGMALNDAVIYKGRVPTLIDVRIYCNRRFVLATRCDGVVAATPTGSTAYSLSAGGPILSPVMDAFIVAPLNPHILTVRPMVFGDRDRLSFRVHNAQDNAVLQLDGRNVIDLLADDTLHVTRAPRKLRFVKLSSKTFYQVLRHKLHMGKRNRP